MQSYLFSKCCCWRGVLLVDVFTGVDKHNERPIGRTLRYKIFSMGRNLSMEQHGLCTKTVDPLWIKGCCFVNRPICPVLLSPFQTSNIDSPYVTAVVHVNSHINSEKSHKKICSLPWKNSVIITETIQFGTLISITNEPEDFFNRHFVVTVFCIINYSMVMH